MARVVLLDTHVIAWNALEPRRLSRAALRALDTADRRLLPAIALRELAMQASRGRLTIVGSVSEWLEDLISEQEVEVVPIDARIAARSVHLAQNFHPDPADQLIAATAIELDVPLITADDKLRSSNALRTIW